MLYLVFVMIFVKCRNILTMLFMFSVVSLLQSFFCCIVPLRSKGTDGLFEAYSLKFVRSLLDILVNLTLCTNKHTAMIMKRWAQKNFTNCDNIFLYRKQEVELSFTRLKMKHSINATQRTYFE